MKSKLLIGALAALTATVPVAAQDANQPKQATPEQVQTAVKHLSMINGVLASEQAPKPLKDALFRCLFGAPLGAISEQATNVIELNEQLEPANDQHNVIALALTCGVTPEQLAAMDEDAAQQ